MGIQKELNEIRADREEDRQYKAAKKWIDPLKAELAAVKAELENTSAIAEIRLEDYNEVCDMLDNCSRELATERARLDESIDITFRNAYDNEEDRVMTLADYRKTLDVLVDRRNAAIKAKGE